MTVIFVVCRRAVGRMPLRQEAAVPVLGLPRAGRVRAQHRPGRALRLRGGPVRGARRARRLAARGRGRGQGAVRQPAAERDGRGAHRAPRHAARRARRARRRARRLMVPLSNMRG